MRGTTWSSSNARPTYLQGRERVAPSGVFVSRHQGWLIVLTDLRCRRIASTTSR